MESFFFVLLLFIEFFWPVFFCSSFERKKKKESIERQSEREKSETNEIAKVINRNKIKPTTFFLFLFHLSPIKMMMLVDSEKPRTKVSQEEIPLHSHFTAMWFRSTNMWFGMFCFFPIDFYFSVQSSLCNRSIGFFLFLVIWNFSLVETSQVDWILFFRFVVVWWLIFFPKKRCAFYYRLNIARIISKSMFHHHHHQNHHPKLIL